MRALRVALNNKKLCLAGIDNGGVLTAIVSWVTSSGRDELSLEVAGLVSATNEDVRWINQRPLRLGDELRIKILEVPSVDEPTKRHRSDPDS
jgi:hypothetical protein